MAGMGTSVGGGGGTSVGGTAVGAGASVGAGVAGAQAASASARIAVTAKNIYSDFFILFSFVKKYLFGRGLPFKNDNTCSLQFKQVTFD
jgi:hypothetical protein